MKSLENGPDPELEGIPTSVTPLPGGKVLLHAWKGVTLSGPQGTFTSTPFGHSLSVIIDDDELAIAAKAADMRTLIRTLNADARDEAYNELIEHINAVNGRRFGGE